ncbi:MAG: four-carbon acid sugar kinase family protein [Desulfobacterales bacterium]|jgi:uncharacterized protein YgbK (DUF1537 family)
MAPILGCIADDMTGATDLALMLGSQGMPVIQYIGLPDPSEATPDEAAVVVGLKSRTCPVRDAVTRSLDAFQWLKGVGADRFFFKYCSTFDSTDKGNIGPVAEALLKRSGGAITVVCPAFPLNGRTVYQGHLFVEDLLLSDSGMRHHPLTPMTDANLVRFLGRQVGDPRSVGLISLPTVEKGPETVGRRIAELAAGNVRFAVVDAVKDSHLFTIARAVSDLPLVTGASALAMGLPKVYRKSGRLQPASGLVPLVSPPGHGAVLAGSCSEATRRQVRHLARTCPSFVIDPIALAAGDLSIRHMVDWALDRLPEGPVIITSSASPDRVVGIKHALGDSRAGTIVEDALSRVALALKASGVRKLIVAGGETAGAVVTALGIRKLRIGPEIEPGVPWTVDGGSSGMILALKSGNFGSERFFSRALEMVS